MKYNNIVRASGWIILSSAITIFVLDRDKVNARKNYYKLLTEYMVRISPQSNLLLLNPIESLTHRPTHPLTQSLPHSYIHPFTHFISFFCFNFNLKSRFKESIFQC